MDDRHKRLAAAKRKLHQYKNQKKQDDGQQPDSPVSVTKWDENDLSSSSKEDNQSMLSEVQELSFSTSAESAEVPLDNFAEQMSNNGSLSQASNVDSESSKDNDIPQSINMSENCSPERVGALPMSETVQHRKEIPVAEIGTQYDQELDFTTHNDVLENLEKEILALRRENSELNNRASGLVQQLETSEKLIRDLRKEVNQFKQHGNIHQQLEELQEAIVVVSKSKMNLAEELSNEQDKNKELNDNFITLENEVQTLRKETAKLIAENGNLKSKLEEEAMKTHVLEDNRRHFNARYEALQAKLSEMEKAYVELQKPRTSDSDFDEHNHHANELQCHGVPNGNHNLQEDDADSVRHQPHGQCQDNNHSHDHGDHHDHGHSECDLNQSEESRRSLVEMEKTLRRLEWENATYEAELVKLGPLKNLEPKCEELQKKNAQLREEIDRLEHLVIQLQGENDTIGDYIHLYQTQRLALRQHAKENDELVEALSKEKNELLVKLSELNHAVEKLASQPNQGAAVLETKIRDLIVDVNTKVHEPYTCAVCSGSRLMTV